MFEHEPNKKARASRRFRSERCGVFENLNRWSSQYFSQFVVLVLEKICCFLKCQYFERQNGALNTCGRKDSLFRVGCEPHDSASSSRAALAVKTLFAHRSTSTDKVAVVLSCGLRSRVWTHLTTLRRRSSRAAWFLRRQCIFILARQSNVRIDFKIKRDPISFVF